MGLEFETVRLGRWMGLGTRLEFNKCLSIDLHLWCFFSLTFYGGRDSHFLMLRAEVWEDPAEER